MLERKVRIGLPRRKVVRGSGGQGRAKGAINRKRVRFLVLREGEREREEREGEKG